VLEDFIRVLRSDCAGVLVFWNAYAACPALYNVSGVLRFQLTCMHVYDQAEDYPSTYKSLDPSNKCEAVDLHDTVFLEMSTRPQLVPGYPKLAHQQARETQTSIYRSFSALNARLILYLQAELHKTELELLATEVADHEASGDVRPFICKDWETLEESGLHKQLGDEAVYKQFEIIERVKVLLPRYCRCLPSH
jgi:hypothetical protein